MAAYRRIFLNNSTHLLSLKNNLLHPCPLRLAIGTRQFAHEKPKRPASAFVQFSQDVRSQIQKENPQIPSTYILQKAASLWANLDPATKQKYKDEYVRIRDQYKINMQKYKESLTPEDKEQLLLEKAKSADKIDSKRKLQALGKPKKPPNAFILFMNEQNVNVEGSTKRIKICSEMWKSLSDEQKQKYLLKASEELEQYGKRLLDWEKKMAEMGYTEFVRKQTRNRLSNLSDQEKE